MWFDLVVVAFFGIFLCSLYVFGSGSGIEGFSEDDSEGRSEPR